MKGDDTTADLLMAAARTLRRRFAVALESYDVTPAQSRALHVVADHGASRPSEIAEALRIAPRSATEVIDALETRGLVSREPDPTDRRATRVAATEEGRRLSAVLAAARRQESERLLEDLPAGDRAELDRILRQLLADR
ncbi:MarR family transcriptional regulator [Nocardioides sp. CER19]|uniref:MarR family winged helix-turn-helix transcriptional regulator n=1 Tax=Nocardioides sp. CER19 TaxID=3038538 RepID=UPI002447850B|nr:MarR family transcriptional regulator [Nocardioides sp. CER19]MDH2416624.1 MarR family transcriptional regulator [Nocardioides sp. CER19]